MLMITLCHILYGENNLKCRHYYLIGKYELSTSSNLFAMRRNFNQDISVAGCCVIEIHAMNTYNSGETL